MNLRYRRCILFYSSEHQHWNIFAGTYKLLKEENAHNVKFVKLDNTLQQPEAAKNCFASVLANFSTVKSLSSWQDSVTATSDTIN